MKKVITSSSTCDYMESRTYARRYLRLRRIDDTVSGSCQSATCSRACSTSIRARRRALRAHVRRVQHPIVTFVDVPGFAAPPVRRCENSTDAAPPGVAAPTISTSRPAQRVISPDLARLARSKVQCNIVTVPAEGMASRSRLPAGRSSAACPGTAASGRCPARPAEAHDPVQALRVREMPPSRRRDQAVLAETLVGAANSSTAPDTHSPGGRGSRG